jgi:hypothetical protein
VLVLHRNWAEKIIRNVLFVRLVPSKCSVVVGLDGIEDSGLNSMGSGGYFDNSRFGR